MRKALEVGRVKWKGLEKLNHEKKYLIQAEDHLKGT